MLNFYYWDSFKTIIFRHIYRNITSKIEIQVKYSILITKIACYAYCTIPLFEKETN